MKICIECKRDFKPSSNHKKYPACRSRAFCYNACACGGLKFHRSKTCQACNVPASGEQSATWKTGKIFHKKGYVMRFAPEHPRARTGNYVFEHILVMEEKIGRFLMENENVHHINGVRSDNRIENLELWTKPQPSGVRAIDLLQWARNIVNTYSPIEELLSDTLPSN